VVVAVLVGLLVVLLLAGGAVLALRSNGEASGEAASPVTLDDPAGGVDPTTRTTLAPTTTTTTPPTTPAPAPAPVGRTFTDPDGVYELTIASSWQPMTAPMKAMEMWRTGASDGSAVNINDTPNVGGASFDLVRRSLGPQMEQMMKGMKVEKTDVAVSTTGQQVAVLHVDNTQNAVALKQQAYVFVSPQRLVTVTVTAPGGGTEAFAAAEPYVLSLHLLGDI
jgi:hypothetical protein